MGKKSIYDIIKKALGANKRLPQDFQLPQEPTPPNELKFMVGARDGAFAFHASPPKYDDVIKEIVRYFKSGKAAKVTKIMNKHSVIDLIDPLLQAIQENAKELDPAVVRDYAHDG